MAYLTARLITETSGFYRYLIPMGLFFDVMIPVPLCWKKNRAFTNV